MLATPQRSSLAGVCSVPSQHSQLRLRSTQQSQGLGRVPHQPTNTHILGLRWTLRTGSVDCFIGVEICWAETRNVGSFIIFQFTIVSMGWYASRDQGGYLLLDATSYVQLYMIALGRKFLQKKSFQTLLKSLDLIK